MSEFMKNLVKQNKEAMKKEAESFKKEFKRKEDAKKEISNWKAIKPIVEAHIQEQIKISFFKDKERDYIYIKSSGKQTTNMSGFISCCKYDELGIITQSNKKKQEKSNGREKQKIRRSK